VRPIRIIRTTGFRLAALYAGLFGLSVLVLFGFIFWIVSDALRQQTTENIQEEAAALAEEYRGGGMVHTAEIIQERLASVPHPTDFYLLLTPDGQKAAGNLPVLEVQAGWREIPLPLASDAGLEEDEDDATEHVLLALGSELPDRAFLLVGEDLHANLEVKEAIARAFAWAFAVTAFLAAVGGALLSVGFLRRIDAITQTSRAIIEGKLAERVPTRGTGDEFDRLALNLNEMLDRVQHLMESLRQVSSDIAHDLRTPLSRLRQRLEGARSKAASAEEFQNAIDEAIEDTDAILDTFSALLRIAQIESGTRKSAFQNVDLSALMRSLGETYGAVAEDRKQALILEAEPLVRVRGDRELLTQMLANLLENAMRHCAEGTRILLRLSEGEDGAPILVVADNGPGIPAEERKRVLERFYRLERSRSTPGSGLGLSLVAAVAELHGIKLELQDNAPGLKVVLRFPAGSRNPS
jgi:signal transduction histidine kinase